jgi:hypothetical protein
MVAYNLYPETADKTIANDTRQFIAAYLSRHFPDARLIDIPVIGAC